MLDSSSLNKILHQTVQKYPAVCPYLRKLAVRLSKAPALRGRIKLGEHLPDDVLTGLGLLFPSAAIQTQRQGGAFLRLEKTGIAPDDAERWISVLCTALDVPRLPLGNRSSVETDVKIVIDRCRLSFPELSAVWVSLEERYTDLSSAIPIRGVEQVQDELLRLAGAARFLINEHDPLGIAEVGAKWFGDSKALKSTSSLARKLEEWLLLIRDEEVTEEARRRVWGECGVVDNATAVKVTLFGPLVYVKNGERFDWITRLHALGETATLSWDNVQNIDHIELPNETVVITCENETPFVGLVRDRLSSLIIYTAGYPNTAVQRILHLLPAHISTVRHWGDSDLDGLRIAALINHVRPVDLWRCNLAELQRHENLLIELTPERCRRAQEYLAKHSDFPFKGELSYTIVNGWLEQEQWSKIH